MLDGLASLEDVEAVDFVGKDEIYYGLDPEGTVFGGDVGEGGYSSARSHGCRRWKGRATTPPARKPGCCSAATTLPT